MQLLNDIAPWWGWYAGPPLSLAALVANDTLTAETAALLSWAVSRGASLFVAAMPRLAGKTTLAGSFLPFLPMTSRLYTINGHRDPVTPPAGEGPLYLLINELSNHTPLYVWGPSARRAFAQAETGARLLGTLHAGGAASAAAVMMQEQGLTAAQCARAGIIVSLSARRTAMGVERRVTEVGLLAMNAAAIEARPLASWDRAVAAAVPEPTSIATLAAYLQIDRSTAEAAADRRAAALRQWVTAGETDWDSVAGHARVLWEEGQHHGAT